MVVMDRRVESSSAALHALENVSSDYFGFFLERRGLQPQVRIPSLLSESEQPKRESVLPAIEHAAKRVRSNECQGESGEGRLLSSAEHASGKEGEDRHSGASDSALGSGDRGASSPQEHVDGMTCKLCSREFTRRWHAVDHVRRVHFAVKRFQCKECSVQFKQKTSLRAHMRSSHCQNGPEK